MPKGGAMPGAGRPPGSTTDNPKAKRVTIRLYPDDLDRIQRIAGRLNISQSEAIRRSIAEFDRTIETQLTV